MRNLWILAAAVAFCAGCAHINERAYYKDALDKFVTTDKGMPTASARCWLAPDLNGGSVGNNVIAEEEFTKYLLAKELCRVIEKHPDVIAGYTWPTEDRCPCGAGACGCRESASPFCSSCNAGASAGGLAAGGGGIGGLFGGLGGNHSANDNNRSEDKLLERYKKMYMPDKLITYRIDYMDADKCTIHFRVSDVKKFNGTIEASDIITVPSRPGDSSN